MGEDADGGGPCLGLGAPERGEPLAMGITESTRPCSRASSAFKYFSAESKEATAGRERPVVCLAHRTARDKGIKKNNYILVH